MKIAKSQKIQVAPFWSMIKPNNTGATPLPKAIPVEVKANTRPVVPLGAKALTIISRAGLIMPWAKPAMMKTMIKVEDFHYNLLQITITIIVKYIQLIIKNFLIYFFCSLIAGLIPQHRIRPVFSTETCPVSRNFPFPPIPRPNPKWPSGLPRRLTPKNIAQTHMKKGWQRSVCETAFGTPAK